MKISEKRLMVLQFVKDNDKTSSFKIADFLKLQYSETGQILRYFEDKGMVEWHHITLDGNIDVIRIKADGDDFLESNRSKWRRILNKIPKELHIHFHLPGS